MNIPNDRQYTKEHEWIDASGRVGVTDFAQSSLGDVVFVDMPAVGQTFKAGAAFGVVESVKSVSDLYAPVDGEVVAVNTALGEHPEWLNEDPYGKGWIIEMRRAAASTELLDANQYGALTDHGGEV